VATHTILHPPTAQAGSAHEIIRPDGVALTPRASDWGFDITGMEIDVGIYLGSGWTVTTEEQ